MVSTRYIYRLMLAGLICLLVSNAQAVDVQRVISEKGIEAWLVEDHSNPIIALRFSFRGAGSRLDPAGKEGVANLLSATLDEGAGPYDSQAFQQRLEDRSISLSFSTGLDDFSGQTTSLTKHHKEAFRLLRLALTEARFDNEPIDRIRSQILVGLKRASEDPGSIAGRSLQKLLFPENRYSRPRRGSSASLTTISDSDLGAYLARNLTRDRLVIGVVGDLDAKQLASLLDETFGDLPQSSPDEDTSADETITVQGAGKVVVIEKDIPQTIISMAQSSILRDDPDYYTAYVVTNILGGGGFDSRLYEEIRVKRGLAYSVSASLSPLDRAGLLSGGTATQNARAGQSLDLLRQEWRRMAEEGPTADELKLAKTYLTGSFPLRLSSSSAIAGMLVGIQLNDLGIDYIDARNSYIEAVTLEDAKRVAQRIFDADALTVVVVGKPEGIVANSAAPTLEP